MKSTESKITQIFKQCTPFCIDLDEKDSYIIDTTKNNSKNSKLN